MTKRYYGEVSKEINSTALNSDISKKTKFSDENAEIKVINSFFAKLATSMSLTEGMQQYFLEAQQKLIEGEDIDDITIPYKFDAPFLDEDIPLLHYSILSGQSDIFKVLLKNTRDFNLTTYWKQFTPLDLAAAVGNLEMLRSLLNNKKVDIEKVNAAGYTAFGMAYASKQYDTAKELLKYGCNIQYSRDYTSRNEASDAWELKMQAVIDNVEKLANKFISSAPYKNFSENLQLLNEVQHRDNDIYNVVCGRVEHLLGSVEEIS